MLDNLCQLIPKELLNESGSILYSGKDAFTSNAELYILGLNPGGDPKELNSNTIAAHTKSILETKPTNWSEYRDEIWEGKLAGKWGMQPRVLHLLSKLSLDPGKVPSSNLIFVRSRRESTLTQNKTQLAKLCWPFHEAVINEIKPKVILCFGQTVGKFVKTKLAANTLLGEFVEQNNRKWTSRAFSNDYGVTVVIATHPSIADWKNPKTDPSHLLEMGLMQ
jgi:hypothetical protein